MNLKLIKPDYANKKKQMLINCAWFDDLNKGLVKGNEMLKGDMNKNVNVIIKKKISLIDIHEKRHQIDSIFKRYNNTLRKKKIVFKKRRDNDPSGISPNKTHNDKNNNNMIITQLLHQGDSGCWSNSNTVSLPIRLSSFKNSSSRPKYDKATIFKKKGSVLIIGMCHSSSLFSIKGNASLNNSNPNNRILNKSNRNKNDDDNSQIHNSSLPLLRHDNHIRKLFVDQHTILKESDDDEKDKFLHDKNVLFEKLRREHQFYVPEENSFDKNKWKLFKQHFNIQKHLLPKHSIHYIQTMHRKDTQKEL